MYRSRQVIVDQDRKDSAKKRKRMDVRIKKRLLPLTKIKAYKVLAGILAPHTKKLQPDLLPGQDRCCRAPIHFPFITRLRVARNKGAGCIDCLLYTSPSPRDRTRSRMPSSACNKKKI